MQTRGLPVALSVTGAGLLSHTAEEPRLEFKISLGKFGLDFEACMVGLRRLGHPVIVSVVQVGLTDYTSNGKAPQRVHAVLCRPQDVGRAPVSCGMDEHRLTATAEQMPALKELIFTDPQSQIDKALEELPGLLQQVWHDHMPGAHNGLKPDISAHAVLAYISGVNLLTGKPIQQPDRDNAPLAIRLLKAMGLATTVDFGTFHWNAALDVTSLLLSQEDHSYAAMRTWEAEFLGLLDGSGTL